MSWNPCSEGRPSREEIEKSIAERVSAKKGRDFARADAIRQELAAQGVILEDTKEGTRWKYATGSNEPRP